MWSPCIIICTHKVHSILLRYFYNALCWCFYQILKKVSAWHPLIHTLFLKTKLPYFSYPSCTISYYSCARSNSVCLASNLYIHHLFYRLRYKLTNPAVPIMRQIVSEQFCELDRHWLVFHYCMFQNAITVLMFSADIYAHVRRLLQQQPLVQSILPNTFSCGKPEVRPPRQFLCLPL